MIFETVEHARHYASGQNIEIMIYKNKVVDVSDFKYKHPGIKKYIIKHALFILN
jgi:cytochrome b involved in lipid metabolism